MESYNNTWTSTSSSSEISIHMVQEESITIILCTAANRYTRTWGKTSQDRPDQPQDRCTCKSESTLLHNPETGYECVVHGGKWLKNDMSTII